MKNKKANRNANIVIAIICILAFSSIALMLIMPIMRGNVQTTNVVTIPTAKAIITSKDGSTHSVSANFSIDVKSREVDKVDRTGLSTRISTIMADLDYDKIISADGTSYVKEKVMDELGGVAGKVKIERLYLTDMQSGMSRLFYEDGPVENKRNDTMKEIFQGIK